MATSSPEPVLGASHGGLRIRLVRAGPGPEQPFVVLNEGRFSRIHLAEIVTDAGERVTRFVLKVQNDATAKHVKGHARTLTNLDVDEVWDRESSAHEAVRSPHVVARVAVPAGLLRSAPITYCGKVDRYFHPVCGTTGMPLSVCRDDELLASCGLVPYSQDTWRYLHVGSAAPASRTFYRVAGAAGERPRDGVSVRLGNQLFRDWAALVHAPADDAAAVPARAALPCTTCEHRLACYPAPAATSRIPAEDHLRAVAFYDFRALAFELQEFDYDELCILLGGGEPKEVAAAAGSSARQALLQERVPALAAPGQWLFGSDPMRFPREALRQKIAAFLDVCEGLRAVHGALDRPHFAVAPANVMARLEGAAGGAPVRWSFRTSLIDLGSPLRLVPPNGTAPGPAGASPLLEPGPELREDLPMRPFLAPDLQGQDGQTVAMPVVVRQVAGDGADADLRFAIEGQGSANLKQFRPGDAVAVTLGSGGDEQTVQAQVEEIRSRGFAANVVLPRGHAFAQWNGKKVDARLSFHRHFGPPVDLYGLGMLLFRTLLVNDEQTMEDVAEMIAKCLRRLEDEASSIVDERQVQARLQQLFHGKDLRARFDASNVLQHGAARDQFGELAAAGNAPIDAALWQSLLVIAFKLTTKWQGFSYAHSHGGASPFVLKQVCADVEAIRRRLHVELFAAEECDKAIATVCNQVLEQLRSDLMSQPALDTTRAGKCEPAPAKGFRLVVERDGEAGQQEYTFDREQVTIGRREVGNLIRLNDPMVSSSHAVIELQAEGWVVVDRNSTNGTEVDGIRLPGDVPQPLQDGTVVVIRPFRLTFHTSAPDLDATSMVRTISTDRLLEQLHGEFAAFADAPQKQQQDALRKVLSDARTAIGPSDLHARLEEIVKKCRTSGAAGDDEQAQLQAKFFTSAHRSLSQLSRTLLGPAEFKTTEDIQAFAARLAKFVETTSQWIERTLDLRRALGKHLEVGATSTGGARGGARTAADVRQLALGWSTTTPGDPAGAFLGRFYDDVVGIIEGLLKGSQQVRRAIRERLDPQKLVDRASREATLALMVKTAAGSALWKLYTQEFQEVTEGKQFELELDRLLQKSLQDRAPGR